MGINSIDIVKIRSFSANRTRTRLEREEERGPVDPTTKGQRSFLGLAQRLSFFNCLLYLFIIIIIITCFKKLLNTSKNPIKYDTVWFFNLPRPTQKAKEEVLIRVTTL